jgi:hypothetical protein
VLTFSFSNYTFPRETPDVAGREEIWYTVAGKLLKSGASTLELVTTQNPGP